MPYGARALGPFRSGFNLNCILRLRAPLLIAFGLALNACMPTLSGDEQDLSGQQVRLTFLHTADIHSRLLPYDFVPNSTDQGLGLIAEAGPFGGATRIASVLKRERAKSERVVHVDSGDSFQGAPIFNVNKGEVEFKFLSQVHLDAAALGNHEFDAGALNFIKKARSFATFPILSANYYWNDPRGVDSNRGTEVTSPFTIKTLKGLKVGIIGMANESTVTSLTEGGNTIQATALEQNESARSYVEFLKPLVDVVVVVTHLGLTEDQDLIQGYEAFYQYGRIKDFLHRPSDPWSILQWYGPEGANTSVVRVHIPGVSGVDVVFGGHLHVVLNPPQLINDPSGRKVLLTHSGAFAKFVGRLDVVLQLPAKGQDPTGNGAEIVSNDYRVIPLDSLWCDDTLHAYYSTNGNSFSAGAFIRREDVQAAVKTCQDQEDRETTQLLQKYIIEMDYVLSLSSVFAYAPADIARRNNSSGGDSPLGNICADSMRKRQTVEAEMALTNSLGIRDNLYAGPLTQEAMFNVFPFENTINIMYLGGDEIQELFDFVTDRSSDRGCVSQAQVSGVRFTMDCAQTQLNALNLSCDATRAGTANGSDCPTDSRDGRFAWQCLPNPFGGGRCYAHTAENIIVNGEPLERTRSYKIAVNDYIAQGGSGFNVLKRNTTRFETGISLRDSIVGEIQSKCSCDDINAGRTATRAGVRCGDFFENKFIVSEAMKSYCEKAKVYQDGLGQKVGGGSCADVLLGKTGAIGADISAEMLAQCNTLPGPTLGKCSCVDALQARSGVTSICGNVTQTIRNFCTHPTSIAIGSAAEDGRIARRVK